MTQPQPIQRELFPGRDRLPVPGPERVLPPGVKLARALRRYPAWALASFLLAALSVMALMMLMPPLYRAEATVEISAPARLTGLTVADPFAASDVRDLHTLEWQFNSRASAEEVVRRLHLERAGEQSGKQDGRAAARLATRQVLNHLEIEPVQNSRVLLIRYRDTDAGRAARVVNALIAATTERLQGEHRHRMARTRQVLEAQLESSRAKLRDARAKMRAFAGSWPEVAFGGGQGSLESTAEARLRSLEAARTQAQIQADAQESQVQVADGTPSTLLPASLGTELPSQLLLRRADLETRIRRLAAQYTPQALPLVEARHELNGMDQLLQKYRMAGRQRDRSDWRAKEMQIERLNQEIARQQAILAGEQKLEEEYASLQRTVEQRSQLCDSLARRAQRMTVEEDSPLSPVHVVDAALPPRIPIRPRRGLEAIAALLAGLLVAPGIALLRDRMEDRLEAADASELGLPLLAVIPEAVCRRGGSDADRTAEGSQALWFDPVLVSLHSAAQQHGSRVYLVTGPGPEAVRGALLMNLARALAESGSPVLVIDAGFRSPRLPVDEGTPERPGLAEVLVEHETLHAAIHFLTPRSLCVLPAGEPRLTPGQLLSLPAMEELLFAARRQYQWVLVAGGPLLEASESRLLMQLVDASLVILPARHTTRRVAARAMDRLREWKAPTLGAVMVDGHPVQVAGRLGQDGPDRRG